MVDRSFEMVDGSSVMVDGSSLKSTWKCITLAYIMCYKYMTLYNYIKSQLRHIEKQDVNSVFFYNAYSVLFMARQFNV